MTTALDPFLSTWPLDPGLSIGLAAAAIIYLRGWRVLNRRQPGEWPASVAATFFGGLLSIYLALASPIEALAPLLVQAHMLQHMLLMMVAPPLVWLGAPMLPLLRGLPRTVRVGFAIPLMRWPLARRLAAWLTHPAIAALQLTLINWAWHTPAAYELALRSAGWHYVQHACFFASGLLFWYPVVRPRPAAPRWSAWLLPPMLIFADVQNTLLAALLTFSRRTLYPFYEQGPRLGGISVIDDQSTAGVVMWLIGSLALLPPLAWIGARLLSGAYERRRTALAAALSGPPRAIESARTLLPILSLPAEHRARSAPAPFNVLNRPLIGPFLKWRHARTALQIPLLLLAGVMIFDGFTGPQSGALNLAGVLPWIHWRGLLIAALLVAGNVFCMACPFTLSRGLARRWLPIKRAWPRALRNKWLAIALLVVFLWAYEAFSLWDRPYWTAWIALGYFVLSFVVDSLFQGAAFCKYVCPIGQFNFVQSLVSPLTVQVVSRSVCTTCQTKDCIRGGDGIPGCEMRLFQPRKIGNMDCTFCLDCVHACPHENVGILLRPPGAELSNLAPRSGIGSWVNRPDIAALVVLLTFGSFANAAGMVAPVVEAQSRLCEILGQQSPLLPVTLFYIAALLAVPAIAVGAAAIISRSLAGLSLSWTSVATRFSYALAPIGFGMWLAHYGFHFLTSYDAIVPTTMRFARDWGLSHLPEPEWIAACCRPISDSVLRIEILCLDFGLLLSLYVAWRIALGQTATRRRALGAFLPWAILIIALFATGLWIIFQPMQMRGLPS